MRYRIRGISVISAAQTGFVVGMIVGTLPVLLNTAIVQWFAHGLYDLLKKTDVDIVPTINLADKLGLRPAITSLDAFDKPLTYLLLFVGGIVFTGLLLGGLGALSAYVYNRLYSRLGGLDVTLEPIGASTGTAQQSAPLASRPDAPPPIQALPPTTALSSPPSLAVTGPRLCLASNPDQMWPVNKSPYLMGSAPANDWRDRSLLPQHARLEFEPAIHAYILYDLSNGQTWVNGRPIQVKNKLNTGFRIRLGQVELVYYA